MKINILLPHKEKFDIYKSSAVSNTVSNNLFESNYKKNISIFGQKVDNPIAKNNFIGLEHSSFSIISRNKNLANNMCRFILNSCEEKQIIEIHNRPYLVSYILKKVNYFPLCLFFHNNPQEMRGSKTVKERIFLVKKTEKIYCVSNFIRNKFLEGLEGIEGFGDKVFVVYNGVKRRIKKFPVKRKEVLFVGRLVPDKGVHLFVEAVEKLATKFVDWHFYIIGSKYIGSSAKTSSYAIKVISDFNKIGNNTSYISHMSNEDIQKKMKTTSIVVIPSLWQEPFGLVVNESMSNGSAIIASNLGGIPEIVNKNGILINDIDANKIKNELYSFMTNKKKLEKYQKLSWNNFTLTSLKSSQNLDLHRKEIFKKKN